MGPDDGRQGGIRNLDRLTGKDIAGKLNPEC